MRSTNQGSISPLTRRQTAGWMSRNRDSNDGNQLTNVKKSDAGLSRSPKHENSYVWDSSLPYSTSEKDEAQWAEHCNAMQCKQTWLTTCGST
mmetsp:Transcript_6000/g.13921  ORF Transcript_6000/g.13921 Transcript_6000/m.13921 type:complete len:92 (-) Transcript_6000:91-366(-)